MSSERELERFNLLQRDDLSHFLDLSSSNRDKSVYPGIGVEVEQFEIPHRRDVIYKKNRRLKKTIINYLCFK